MAKRTSKYASMTASDLARETRERGLAKPDGMTNVSEWADWLESLDAQQPSVGEPISAAEAATLPQAEVEVTEAAATDYRRMNKAQLVDLSIERGLDADEAHASTKAELADWLLAADGVTEDAQQAAADTGGVPDESE